MIPFDMSWWSLLAERGKRPSSFLLWMIIYYSVVLGSRVRQRTFRVPRSEKDSIWLDARHRSDFVGNDNITPLCCHPKRAGQKSCRASPQSSGGLTSILVFAIRDLHSYNNFCLARTSSTSPNTSLFCFFGFHCRSARLDFR